MPFEIGASSLFGCAQSLDPHPNQSFAVIFIRPNAECDVPGRRWKFIGRAVEVYGATMAVALAQPKYEMLFVCDSRRRDGLDRTRKEKRLRISISERLQEFVPAQKFDSDACERQLVIQS
jgi:hypothetical protein